MNKQTFLAILIALLIPFMGLNFVNAQSVPGVWTSTNKKSYSPGESGLLTINFKTGSKVKIPKDPEILVELTTGEVEGQGLQDYTGGEGDYVEGSKVRYNFTVPGGAASGSTLNISGSVRFAYCSTVDGVCKIATKNFTAKVRVK